MQTIETKNKPQIMSPRVTSLQSRASGGRIHVDCHASRLRAHVCQRTGIRGRASSRGATLDVCPRRAYVGTKSRSVAFGVGVYTYALRGIRGCGVENPQGFGIDKRRFVAPDIEQLYPAILSNSPQRTQRSQSELK